MLPSAASGAYAVTFEIDINRGDDLSLKEHWQDHAQPSANGHETAPPRRKRATAPDAGEDKPRRRRKQLPASGTYFETVPFNENDFSLKSDAAAGPG